MVNKVTFGIIVTTRSFFNSELAREDRSKFLKKMDDMGFNYVILSEEDTELGVVQSLDDAKKCAELFKKHADEIKGIIVALPNFGEEMPVTEAIVRSKLDVPILIQASDDDVSEMGLDRRRDAFCGKISVCNNLYQYDVKFTNTTQHTCDVNSEVFTKDLIKFEGICRLVDKMHGLRVAAIGARPNAFNTVRFSEKLLQKYGITTVVTDLSEIIAKANSIENNESINVKTKEIKDYAKIMDGISNDKINKQARLALTIEKFIKDNDCQASAIQCWNSIQNNYGCATCLSMSMMGEVGKPSACEMDITGAVTMYALSQAASSPAGYLDWNNNFMDNRDMCVNLHCSNFPKSFFNTENIEVGNLDVLATTIDVDKCFGAVKGKVSPGAMTYAKITTDDKNGIIKAYVGEGEFVENTVETKGGVALCRVNGLQSLLNHICTNGYEHHVSMVRGSVADIFEEALGKYLGIQVYRHKG